MVSEMNTASDRTELAPRPLHPLIVRITHWINAVAIICMIMSGLRIYNASAFFPFHFPNWMTLGGWLAGALAWHFAIMWLLVANGLVYLVYGLASGHFRRHFMPITPAAVWADLKAAFSLKLVHELGVYNAVQRLLYVGVIGCGILVVLSGLAIWKPVQLQGLTAVFGGYEGGRRVHFFAMSGIAGFLLVHLALVAIVPRTLLPMIIDRGTSRHRPPAEEPTP